MLAKDRKAKHFFTYYTRFQLKYHFRKLASHSPEEILTDSQDIPIETSTNKFVKLPPISKSNHTQLIQIPGATSFHGFQQLQNSMYKEKNDDPSIEKIESPSVARNNEAYPMPIELINFLKSQENGGNKQQIKKNKGVPLKIGDIIFFKFTPEISQINIKNSIQSVITGDGIASNKIECVPCEPFMRKNALNMFRKSLFRIENNKKYSYTKKYVMYHERKDDSLKKIREDDYNKLVKFWEQKAKDEKEDNIIEYKKTEGQSIIYGQAIQLKHLYSDCYLTLKSEDLARQNGCVEMTLEENDTDHCNFKILPINNLRNIGDVVSYSDIINLVSCAEENYYFHIASELILLNSSPEKQIPIEETLSNGLEVNGSEIQTNLKVNCYLNYTENKKNEEITTKFLLNGDIITIFNRETGGVLTVAPRNVKEYFIEKPVLISSGDDKHGHQAQNSFMIQFLRSDNVTESDEKLGVFIQKAAKELDQKSFNSLWEVQRKKTFDGSVLDLSESFRLKNIATGLFLSVNKAGKPELLNTAGNIKGRDSNCYFTFVSKFMTNEQENTIKYDESLKIKVSDSHSCFLGYGEVLCPISFSVFFSDRKGDSTKFLFELKSSDQKSRNFADRISSLVPYLMKFYTFLQSFGMLEERNKQRNNEESFRYDYERALHQEKDLENEIKQLFESLQNLNNFLQVKINQEDETMFRMRQNILNDQKILELLIAITHLIDQMCRGNVLHLDPKGNLSLIHSTSISAIKKQDRQGSSYKNLDKTPFAIAKKHLERPMKAIFEFLYFSIKGNQKSSQFILEFDDFFKNQLKFYFREISMLLKEAIRCAFLLKKNDIYGNQLLEWIKLLENLNEMSKNIENQALYLELIACALIDAYDCPVTRYQEKSLQELFSVQQGKKLRLLRFNIMVDKAGKERAVISFPKDESLHEFLENNHSLRALNIARGDQSEEETASFYVDEFEENDAESLIPFIDYICANLKLLSYLIKGRNLKSVKKVKTLGITSYHIMLVISSQKVHNKIKANYLHLFQYLFLDKEPFIHLSQYENRCIIWNDLDKFSIQSQTFRLINNIELQIKSSLEASASLKDFAAIEEILIHFWSETGIPEFEMERNYSIIHQIELFMIFLKLTRVIVDLGYSNKVLNDNILYGIGHIFAPIMEEKIKEDSVVSKEKVFEKNGLNQKYWSMRFMKKIIESSINNKQEEIEAILHQTTNIFMIFTKIRINLQIINFLKIFKIYQKDSEQLQNFSDFEYLFHIYDFNLEKAYSAKSPNKMSEKVSEQFFNQLIKKNLNIYSDKVYQGLHLDSIFLYSLFSTNFMSVRLRRNMLQILVDYFNQRSHLLSELIEIEIIDTDEELKIYHELDGITPISEQLVSIKRLDFLIEKLLRNYELIEFLNKNKNQSQAKADNYYRGKQEKTIEIIAILEILNAKLKERKSNPYLFLKTQNILRNLQYHEVFMKILKNLHPREPAEFLLMQRIIVFLRYFTFLNGINQQQILSNSNIFFELMNDKLCIKRLISSTLEITKGNNAIFEHINNYFDLLENLESFKKEVHPFVILQILSILQSLVCTQEKTFLPRIQKKILSRLLKNKKLLKFTMKKSYLDYKNSLMLKLQKVQNNEKYMEKLMIHLNVIHLFGNLCRDFRMGTLQMQKVLVYEQMKNLLFDANTPFIFKKVYLKALFQVYIVQLQKVNDNFSPNDLAEILNLLVLPDLNVYTKYLEGIVSLKGDTNHEESAKSKEFREKIIENRNYYQSALDVQVEDKSSNPKKPLNISQGTGLIFDSKKIIDDSHEYWEYLFGGKTWDNSRDGLLFFLLDCYYEAHKRNWLSVLFESNDSLTDALSLIKSCLVRMKGTLQKLEKDFNLNLSNYYLLIMEGISQLPTKIVTKAGKALKIQNDNKGNYKMEKINVREEQDPKLLEEEQQANNNLKDVGDILLDKIRTFLIVKRMKINDFLNLFNIKLEIVPKESFMENFLNIITEETKSKKQDIENLIEKWSIAKNGPNFVNFRKFCDKMRKFFIKKKFNYEEEDQKKEKKEINLEETENSFKKDSLLLKFIMSYYNKSLKNNRNNELKDLAIKFKKNLEDLYNGLDDEEMKMKGYTESIKKMISVFSTDFSSIFLIKIMRIFLEESKPDEVDEDNNYKDEEEEAKKMALQKKSFRFIQNAFERAGVCFYGLQFIKAKIPLLYVYEAINLLINCLEFGNNNIQASILNVLKKEISTITSPFFNFIKGFLMHQGKDSDFDKIPKKPSKFRLEQFSQEELILLTDDKFINKDKVAISIVLLLSLCCENCYAPFQNFLREQTFEQIKQNFVSNNIVLEASNFLACISSTSKSELVAATLTTLTEFNLGPCNENQNILCNNKRLTTYMNESILLLQIDFASNNQEEYNKILVFSKAIEFLLSLAIGHKNNDNLIKLVTKLEISELFYKMDQIFKKRIRRYIRPILIEDHTYLTDESRNIIKTGFNIFILLTIFKEAYPTHASLQIFNTNTPFSSKKYKELKLKFNQRKKQLNPKRSSKKITPVFSPRKSKKLQATYIEFEKTAKSNFLKMEEEEKSQENDETEYLKRNSDQALEPKINKKLDEVDNEVLKIEFKEYFELKAMKSMKASLLFYKGLVGSVEVQRGECLSKIYFQKPFVSDFKTPNIKYNLIYMANRESDQARLEHLFYNVESYYQEMKHRQKIYRHHLLNFFIGFWRSLKDISFLLICAINVLLLASYEHKEAFLDANGNTTSDVYLQNILTDTNQIITAIQLFICFFVVIFCMIERYPVSINARIGQFTAIKKNSLKNQAGLEMSNRSLFSNFIIRTEIKIENFFKRLENSRYKYSKILFDPENIYNLIYLAVTLIAFFYPLVYCLLLLDLIKRSEDLQNIIKAVTLNVGSLVKTALLGAAVIYMFSVISYLRFWNYYDGNSPNVYAQTLLRAYTSTLNAGLRSGGGIGDVVGGPSISDEDYWSFWVFTLVFYIIINILFINIIFGIIIDTFGELRDMRKELIKDVEEKCFICGVDSYDFETKGNGWLDHIYLEHNVYHYLDFLIYIREKNINDCNGIEKHVKELVNKKNIEFLPIGMAMALIPENEI